MDTTQQRNHIPFLPWSIKERIVLHHIQEEYGVSKDEMMAKNRKHNIVMGRHCWRFNLWNYSDYSLHNITKITQTLGGDHTTVMHSRNIWRDYSETNQDGGLQEYIKNRLNRVARRLKLSTTVNERIYLNDVACNDFDELKQELKELGINIEMR